MITGKTSQLCAKCILPANYAGISFNEKGICNFCERYKSPRYLGEERLKKDVFTILNENKHKSYDCVVGLSGGRDSTYLLWYIVNVLKIKPLAVFVDSKLIPETTVSNVKKTVNLLGVDLKIRVHEFLEKSVKHFLMAWLKNPDPATLITLCTGCRYGMRSMINEETAKRNIPILFEGGTPFEKGYFKKNLISTKRKNSLSFILGYGKKLIYNPSLISNLSCLKIQINEYITLANMTRKLSYVRILPFTKYFRWEEKKIEDTLKSELKWERYPGLESSYRGDCEVGVVRQFLYNKMLNYNDKEDHLSWLIRDNQITREEALTRISKEKETKVEIIGKAFEKLGIDYSEYIDILEKNARKLLKPDGYLN
jgi:hypothetical protein